METSAPWELDDTAVENARVPGKHNHNNNRSSKNVWTMKTNCKEDRVSQLPVEKFHTLLLIDLRFVVDVPKRK